MECGAAADTVAAMSQLEWIERSDTTARVLVIAFGGWNDAGDAATGALDHLVEHWAARPVASIDPEDFYDFTATRPVIVRDERGQPSVSWPGVEVLRASPGTDEVVLVRGAEPQLRWRTFSGIVSGLAAELGVELVVTLGAFVAEVPHTRETPVVATAHHGEAEQSLGLDPSHYEGQTGIIGVLHDECRSSDLPSAALWAAIPSYVPSAPSPKAALALVEAVTALLGLSAPTMELTLEAAAYEHEISELVDEDEVTAEYVRGLEELVDADAMVTESPSDMVDEVERFLRDQ